MKTPSLAGCSRVSRRMRDGHINGTQNRILRVSPERQRERERERQGGADSGDSRRATNGGTKGKEEIVFVVVVAAAAAADGDDHHRFLSKLLSQLETVRGNGKFQRLDPKELPPPAVTDAKSETANETEGGRKEIVRELEKIQRQNFITHCLLSVMIVVTVAWQLCEVSLILKITNGLRHPFRALSSMFSGMLKGRSVNDQKGDKDSPTGSMLTGVLKGRIVNEQNEKKEASATGSLLAGMLKGGIVNEQNEEKESSATGSLLTGMLKGSIGNDQEGEKDSSSSSILTGLIKGSMGNDQNGEEDSSTSSMLTDLLKRSMGNDQDGERETSQEQKQIEVPLLPPIKLPELLLSLGKKDSNDTEMFLGFYV